MSKIPEGATHTLSGATVEYKKLRQGSHSMWLTYVDGDWIDTVNATPQMYAPISVEWNGEGLPPIGVVCEINNDPWEMCTVIAHGIDESKPHAVAQCDSGLWMEVAGEFRALRTPDQIAFDDRLHKIRDVYADISKTIERFENDISGGGAARAVIEAMIDAGYAKQVGK